MVFALLLVSAALLCWVPATQNRQALSQATRMRHTVPGWRAFRARQRLGTAAGLNQVLTVSNRLSALLNGGQSGPRMWLTAVSGSAAGQSTDPVLGRLAALCSTTSLWGSGVGAAIGHFALALPERDPRRIPLLEFGSAVAVSESSGMPLKEVLTGFGAYLQDSVAAEAAQAVAFAGPRATARILGWLPVLGLLVAYAMGVDPLSALLRSLAGNAVLAVGVGLMLCSQVWMRSLLRKARRG